MKKILLIVLALITGFGIKAQERHEVYRDDKLVIQKCEIDYSYIGFIENCDSDEISLHIIDSLSSIISVDNSLNISLYTNFSQNIIPFLKLNNKIYGYYYALDTISYSYTCNLCILDNFGNTLSSHIINDSLISPFHSEFQKVIVLENKEILFSFVTFPEGSFNNYFDTVKLIKVDTLGNILKTKVFYDTLSKIDIGCIDNQILLSTFKNYDYSLNIQDNFIYYLNRETLEKEDSIHGYYANNLKAINDSILTFYGNFGPSYFYLPDLYIFILNNYFIMNKNTKIIYSIVPIYDYLYDDVKISCLDELQHTRPLSNNIDFINQDSIYSVFHLEKEVLFSDGIIGFGIVNYKKSGDTNFVYKIFFSDSTFSNAGAYGIRATSDGGAILNIWHNSKIYIAKFMPNGLASILDIETKEKETIKVYPNPAKDYINVDIECSNFKKSEIELFDMQGKLVKEANLNSKKENRIDISSLNSGAYTYNVSLNGKTISGKIIVGK